MPCSTIKAYRNCFYTCIKNAIFNIFILPSFYIISVPPKVILTPKNQTVNPGVTITLRCSANGDPIPRVYWLKNNRNWTSSNDVAIEGLFGSSTMSILKATIAHNGHYQCVFKNFGGTVVTTAAVVNIWGEFFECHI